MLSLRRQCLDLLRSYRQMSCCAVRPLPPQQVKVRDKGSGWLVEWAASSPTSVTLHYQVCYCKKQEQVRRDSTSCRNANCWFKLIHLNSFSQECLVQNIPAGSMSLTILQSSLDPSQDYQVRVRSLVKPEDNYSGIPSEWSDPVDWTSHAGKHSDSSGRNDFYLLDSSGNEKKTSHWLW